MIAGNIRPGGDPARRLALVQRVARSCARGASRSTRNFASAATTHWPLSDLLRWASFKRNESSIALISALH